MLAFRTFRYATLQQTGDPKYFPGREKESGYSMTELAITYTDVLAARRRLKDIANRTPVFTSRTLNDLTGKDIYLKMESFQRTGSFKFRGAYNAISRLEPDVRVRGVVAYSSGNHAQGVALAARLLGVPAAIVMNDDAPTIKQQATREYGAEIIPIDRHNEDGESLQYQIANERNMTVIHAYDDPDIMTGQGTAVLELLDEVPELDTILAPVGGGGLISGTLVAAKGYQPDINVFGVETDSADDTKQSLDRGEWVEIPPPPTIADGIRLTTPGKLTFPVVQHYIDDILVVSDEDLLQAMRLVFLRLKLVIEPSGAVPIAAALKHLLPAESERVGVMVSGGNVDPPMIGKLFS